MWRMDGCMDVCWELTVKIGDMCCRQWHKRRGREGVGGCVEDEHDAAHAQAQQYVFGNDWS